MSPNEPAPADAPRPRGGRRRSDDSRVTRRGQWLLLGIAIALVIGTLGIVALTQTGWGRDQVLRYTLTTLGGRLNGTLEVERLEGNVITGARLYEISLTDTSGVPLAVADSAFIRYRLASFLGGDVIINRLTVYDAVVDIYRLPGDTIWNYQEILEDPSPAPQEGAPGATLIERITVLDTHVSIRRPLAADPRLSEEAQEAQIEEILADTARNVLQEVPGGHLVVTTVDVDSAQVEELFIGPDERGGTYLEVVDAVADVRLWRDPPLEIRGGRAQVHLREGILSFSAPSLTLPSSTGQGEGRIDLTGDRPLYDVAIESDRFALSDLRWLYPWLPEDPEEAIASTRLRVQDRPEGLLVHATDLVLDMPGTEVTGTFGMITAPEVLRFVDVDLEAEPLRVESVERLLPEDLPVEGLVIGGAVIRGES